MRITRREFEDVVEETLIFLPSAIRNALQNLAIIVQDRPTVEELEEVGLRPDEYLFGIYRGVPINHRSFFSPGGELPHQIVLYQQDLEDCCPDREELLLQISLTLIHEIGHYLGLDEDELRELERQAEEAMDSQPDLS